MAGRLTDYCNSGGCAAKLPAGRMDALLAMIPRGPADPNLLVGTETHDDAGVYRLTDDLALVQTVDFFPPVMDDPFVYGQIAAANALSDVYAMGGTPVTALNLVAYPDDKLTFDWLGQILAGGADRCREAGCAVVGGHTIRDPNIKFGLSVTGTVHPARVLTNRGARPGDVLVLTKPLGTGFVTAAAKKGVCPVPTLAAAFASMTRLNRDAAAAALASGVTGMTDVTGFGLAGHAREVADGSGVTIRLLLSNLPLLPGVEALDIPTVRTRASGSNREYMAGVTRFDAAADDPRAEFLYDPQTSGGLLIAVSEKSAADLVRRLQAVGEPASAVVGVVEPRHPGLALIVA